MPSVLLIFPCLALLLLLLQAGYQSRWPPYEEQGQGSWSPRQPALIGQVAGLEMT